MLYEPDGSVSSMVVTLEDGRTVELLIPDEVALTATEEEVRAAALKKLD